MLRAIIVMLLTSVAPTGVLANNTGGVFGPVVNDGHQALQYRGAITDDSDFAQRLHVEQALNDDFMWRVVAQTRKTPQRSTAFDYVQGELFWELPTAYSHWQQGFRFDLRLRDGDRPDQAGVNWMHQFQWAEGWSARALLLTTLQFGRNDRAGLGLQLRGSATKRFSRHLAASLAWFSDYGTTAETRGGSDQFHQLGPDVVLTAGNGWQLKGGVLFGLTSATPDATYRLWISRSF